VIYSPYSFGGISSCLEQEKIDVGKNPGKKSRKKLVGRLNSNLKIFFPQFSKDLESVYRGCPSFLSGLSPVPKINISGEHL
jgi:hypothetical protein